MRVEPNYECRSNEGKSTHSHTHTKDNINAPHCYKDIFYNSMKKKKYTHTHLQDTHHKRTAKIRRGQ